MSLWFTSHLCLVTSHEEALEEKKEHLEKVNKAIAKLDGALGKLAEGKQKLRAEIEKKVRLCFSIESPILFFKDCENYS